MEFGTDQRSNISKYIQLVHKSVTSVTLCLIVSANDQQKCNHIKYFHRQVYNFCYMEN